MKKITEIRYYRVSLLLPILLPLAFLPFWKTTTNGALLMLIPSLIFGAGPYLVLACLLYRISKRGAFEFKRWFILSPLIMVLLSVTSSLGFFIVAVGIRKINPPLIFVGWIFTGMYSLIIGYIYVGIINLFAKLLIRLKIILPESE
ncbi:MAG: hypothetical protein GY858_09025 [Candidatus Omnitrophica bacterium]|nr:hypothetical protein [Candidatus Omnitrophota bacterium]